MARGWAIVVAASFGLVSLWNAALPFFVRALSAVGIATGPNRHAKRGAETAGTGFSYDYQTL